MVGTAALGESNVYNRHGKVAQVRDLDAKCLVAAPVEDPHWDNPNTNTVAVIGPPGVEDAKHCAEKSENQPGNGGYERECLHGVAIQSNELSDRRSTRAVERGKCARTPTRRRAERRCGGSLDRLCSVIPLDNMIQSRSTSRCWKGRVVAVQANHQRQMVRQV